MPVWAGPWGRWKKHRLGLLHCRCHCLAGSQTRYAPHRWLDLPGSQSLPSSQPMQALQGVQGVQDWQDLRGLQQRQMHARQDLQALQHWQKGLQHDVQKKWQS
jgi:hypothetical protein